VSGDRVRFTAASFVVQIRLEVYNSSGRKLFDNEIRGGNILDWHLNDGKAETVADGAYLTVVTVKSLSGRITQRIGMVMIEGSLPTVKPANALEMTAQQVEAIGPIENNASLAILSGEEPKSGIVIAHDGEDGQITRSRGALLFRIGDFFKGTDTEQMRLTAQGNLGIGITNPHVKLDVDGLIHSTQGIVFPDGSVQFSASRKTLGAASLAPGEFQYKSVTGQEHLLPDISGTGTTGKIPKWLDGPAGLLGDANLTEVNGAIGVNGTPSTSFRLDVNGSTRIRGSNPGFNLEGLRPAGNVWLFQTVDDDGRFRLFSQDNVNPGLERLTINLNTGNVGIGTTIPVARLAVRGDGTDVLVGSAGCPAPTAAIGFGTMGGCNNFALGGDVSNTGNAGVYLNRPTGQSLHFRENNGADQMTIAPGGDVVIRGRVAIGNGVPGDENFSAPSHLRVRGTDIQLFSVGTADGVFSLMAFNDRTVNIGALGTTSSTTHVCANPQQFGTTIHQQLSICGSAAEYVPTSSERLGALEVGDLVTISPVARNPYGDDHAPFVVTKTTKPCDDNLLGFITDPEKGGDGSKMNEHYLPLGVFGFFPAKVTVENGPVRRGDPITSSSKPGYGMKAIEPCKIIGYALEDADKEGKIQVFAHLSEYAAPEVTKLRAQVATLHRENAAIQGENAVRYQENGRLRTRLERLEESVSALEAAKQRRSARSPKSGIPSRSFSGSRTSARRVAALK